MMRKENSPDHCAAVGWRAIALAFAREGANVAVIYAGSKQAAEEVCQQAAAYGVQAGHISVTWQILIG